MSDTFYVQNIVHKSTTNIPKIYLEIEGYNQRIRFLKINLEKKLDLIEKNECHFWIQWCKMLLIQHKNYGQLPT